MEMENVMMEEIEVMEPEFDIVETDTEETGIGTGLAMLIGAGLTLATTAVVRLGKKAWAKHKKAKKEETEEVTEHDFVVPTDEDIEKVTAK